MSDQLNAEATSETLQIWKTIHTMYTRIHSNKANMKWWLWRPNDKRGPWGPNVSWHLSYRWGKTPKKRHPGNLSRPGIVPGPAAWQARMLAPVPQRWTLYCILLRINYDRHRSFHFGRVVLNTHIFFYLVEGCVQKYRVVHILGPATDGCRSRPCLACPPLHGASNCRCSQTLALFFSTVSE